MIGVRANSTDRDVVRELFELFKTPWEFYRDDREYDVVISADGEGCNARAKLVVVYSSTIVPSVDQAANPIARQPDKPCVLLHNGDRLPIYGAALGFSEATQVIVTAESSGEPAAHVCQTDGPVSARVGYDLLGEVRTILTVGQPKEYAGIPTLELHIGLLKNLMVESGISFVEVPPVPDGFQFIACLTHDVDHPSIRQHGVHTVVGFLLRATFGSLIDALLGRMEISDAAKNWLAALKLPFVYMGLAKDPWRDFDAQYLNIEQGIASTFFVIPRKGYAGKAVDTRAGALRASRYEAREIADSIQRLQAAGCEVGLHGIDAWLDSSSGREELDEVRRLTGAAETGVRMHWLYFNENSPSVLETAGAAYDSTIGYNETVGYRAGTTQAYKPLGAQHLLELPLHAMDTALFYLSYLGLSYREASARLRELTDTVVRHGGCFTINWHDRSLAPERLWGSCYAQLMDDLKFGRAWFATAGQAVAWFRKRRSVIFEGTAADPEGFRAKLPAGTEVGLPGLIVRVHKAREPRGPSVDRGDIYTDFPIGEYFDANVSAVRG